MPRPWTRTAWSGCRRRTRIAIFKFDPKTEQFTEFQLPTRGTDLRHITVDSTTTPVSVWITYNRSNKITRLQDWPAATQQTAAR